MKLSIFYSLVFSFLFFNLANAQTLEKIDPRVVEKLEEMEPKIFYLANNIGELEKIKPSRPIKNYGRMFKIKSSHNQLFKAIERGYIQSVIALISEVSNINIRDSYHGKTLLMHASEGGHAEIVRVLIQAGARVNLISPSGKTASRYALEGGHTEIADALFPTYRAKGRI